MSCVPTCLLFTTGLLYVSYYLYRVSSFLIRYLLAQLYPIDLKSHGSWAVITGGSNGIGLGYAKALARRGLNCFLISNEEEKLKKICQDLSEKYKVKCEWMFFDYSKTDYTSIETTIAAKTWKNEIGILINNVGVDILPNSLFYYEIEKHGFGGVKDRCNSALNINCLSQTAMTALILPIFEKKNKGVILSLSSVASLNPIGAMQVIVLKYSTKISVNQ